MRIRTVKPELFQSQKLGTGTTRDARLLLIGLCLCADDFGRFRAHPALLHGLLFPFEPDANIAGWLAELAALGIIQLYAVNGTSYGVVVNFAEHQKIDKRWPSRLPAPPAEPPPSPAGPPPKPAETRVNHAGTQASPAEERASPPEQSARNGRKPARDRLPEQPARLPEQSARLPETPPLEWNGMEKNPSDARVRAIPPAPEGPAPAPDQQQQTQAAEPETTSAAVVDLHRALLFGGYRSNMKPHDRVRLLLAKAVELDAVGITPEQLSEAIADDRTKATTPGALLAHWIDSHLLRDVVAEKAMKAKERSARARGRAANDAAANGAPVTEPQQAADVAAAALANVRPA